MKDGCRCGLATIGEKCIHLICEFVRAEDKGSQEANRDWGGAWALSRLSRTCRVLYIAVRNLPSVLELQRPVFRLNRVRTKRIAVALDAAYWSNLAGVVWSLSPEHLLEEALPLVHSDTAGDGTSSHSSALRGLFLCLAEAQCKLVVEDTRLVKVIEEVGGLKMPFSVWHKLTHGAAFRLQRCSNLRYLDVTCDAETLSKQNYDTLIEQLDALPRPLEHASVSFYRHSGDMVGIDLSAFAHFHMLSALECGHVVDLSPLQRARSISLSYTLLTKVHLPNVGAAFEYDLISLSRCALADPLSIAARVHTLKLDACLLSQLTLLGTVDRLEVSRCSTIRRVGSSRPIHTVRISHCNSLSDVTALTSARNVELRHCGGLTSIGALGSIGGKVSLLYCSALSCVSGLGHLHSLSISGCNQLSDVAALGTVHTLSISSCRRVSDVAALGNVHNLSLHGCSGITDISALKNVHFLSLSGGSNVTDVAALAHAHTVSLNGCNGITDISALKNVHSLSFLFCSNISDVSALGNVHSLYLKGCHSITDVAPLAGVHRLILRRCSGIKDISALASVPSLTLKDCDNVTNASALSNVNFDINMAFS